MYDSVYYIIIEIIIVIKCRLWKKKILNAEGWSNGKFLIGKHCRAFYLGLPCTGLFWRSTSYLFQLPWRERNTLKLPAPRRGNHSSAAHWEISVMLRTTTVSGNNTGGVTFPTYSHTPYNKKTHIPYLNTQSSNCPCFKWLMGQHC